MFTNSARVYSPLERPQAATAIGHWLNYLLADMPTPYFVASSHLKRAENQIKLKSFPLLPLLINFVLLISSLILFIAIITVAYHWCSHSKCI